MKKKLIRAANRIWELENKIMSGKDEELIEAEMEKIAESLSPEELLEIDEYLMNKRNSKNY